MSDPKPDKCICGGSAVYESVQAHPDDSVTHEITCWDCGLHMSHDTDKEFLFKAWNSMRIEL